MVLIILNKIITKKEIGKINKEKISMYECGFEGIELTKKKKYYIKYFIVGIIFLIFDLEAM